MKVKWEVPGIFKADAEEVAAELEAIETVTAASVVDYAAQHPGGALHSCLEWDNQKAASKYRQYQARKILLNLVVVNESSPAENATKINLYYNTGDSSKEYKPVSVVLNNPDQLSQLKLKCKDYLRAAEKKFSCIESLDLQLLEDLIAGI